MNMLAKLTTSSDIEDEKDSVGGGATVFDSGIYLFDIELAYVKESDGGALGLFLHLKAQDGRESRQTMYMTSGKAKGQKTYYEKDGVKHYLPGFNMANSLALLTTGKEISQLEPEEKVFNLYDFNAKSEVPTKVMAVTDIMGQQIYAGLIKQTVDKSKKNESTGAYEPTGETREENEIDKFFCAKEGFEKLTSAEIKAKRGGQDIAEDQLFHNAWTTKNAGKTRNKATGAAATGTAGGLKTGAAGGAKAAPGAGNKPSTSLFG